MQVKETRYIERRICGPVALARFLRNLRELKLRLWPKNEREEVQADRRSFYPCQTSEELPLSQYFGRQKHIVNINKKSIINITRKSRLQCSFILILLAMWFWGFTGRASDHVPFSVCRFSFRSEARSLRDCCRPPLWLCGKSGTGRRSEPQR